MTEPAGSVATGGYRVVVVDGIAAFSHRVAWRLHHGVWPSGHLDHRNGVTDDNRLKNLRAATASQNSANRRMKKRSKAGYRGVVQQKRSGNWEAVISVEGKRRSLGTFLCPVEAAYAYDYSARILHGEFAVLNFKGGLSYAFLPNKIPSRRAPLARAA